MGHLSNSEFLKAAAELFESKKEDASSIHPSKKIYITQKRLSPVDEVNGREEINSEISKFSTQKPLLTNSQIHKTEVEYPILIRITNGDKNKDTKIKISTVVKPEDLGKFWRDYTSVLKSGIVGLKKKDKSKKKKKSSK